MITVSNRQVLVCYLVDVLIIEIDSDANECNLCIDS